MAAFTTNTPAHNANRGGIVATLKNALGDLTARYVRYRVYTQTLNELSRLSARELDDLGLSHATVHTAAYQAAYGNQNA
ncbi:MAG: DUF1127 domain-containing protein [Pseudomonadota bacterium]